MNGSQKRQNIKDSKRKCGANAAKWATITWTETETTATATITEIPNIRLKRVHKYLYVCMYVRTNKYIYIYMSPYPNVETSIIEWVPWGPPSSSLPVPDPGWRRGKQKCPSGRPSDRYLNLSSLRRAQVHTQIEQKITTPNPPKPQQGFIRHIRHPA